MVGSPPAPPLPPQQREGRRAPRGDRHDREAIVLALEEQLRHGAKSLVGNKGYRKYLQVEGEKVFGIDREKVKAEARCDGKWVLRSNWDQARGEELFPQPPHPAKNDLVD